MNIFIMKDLALLNVAKEHFKLKTLKRGKILQKQFMKFLFVYLDARIDVFR